MSQQELHYGEAHYDGPQASYSGYEGTPQHGGYAPGFYGQKLSDQGRGRMASPGQRLALAIVSLVLLMVMIFGLTLMAAVMHADAWVAIPVLMIIFLFSAAVTIINVVFNRS